MTDDLNKLSAMWIAAKRTEAIAVEERRKVEDRLLSLIGIAENMEGTESAFTDEGYAIKVVGRMNRKVDSEKLQLLAIEAGLEQHLSSLFRWKPEINATIWKAADSRITTPLLGAITTTPGRPSFTITKE